MCNGMPITSSENVADEALFRTSEVISKMIQDRPDMIKELNTREELVEYDPTLAALIREVFKHPDRYDWRYESPMTHSSN